MARGYQIAPSGSTRSNAPRRAPNRHSLQSKIAPTVTRSAVYSESAAKLLFQVVPSALPDDRSTCFVERLAPIAASLVRSETMQCERGNFRDILDSEIFRLAG